MPRTPKFIKYISLGFEVTGMVVAGLFLGKVIGESLGYENLGAVIGTLVGFVTWLAHIFSLTRPKNDDKK